MKKFMEPKAELEVFAVVDVITTSDSEGGDLDQGGDGTEWA